MKTTPRIYCKTDNCRRYANLNDEGYCPTCKPTPPPAEEVNDDPCNCCICKLEIGDGDSTLGCDICGKWAHPKCAGPAELVALIEAIKNNDKAESNTTQVVQDLLFWICPACSNTTKNVKLSNGSLEVDSEEPPPSGTPDNRVSNGTNSHLPRFPTNQGNEGHRVKPICKHYRYGRCNKGNACEFAHPPKCLNYCRYGREGCSGGYANCQLMHPVICKSSLHKKQCFDSSCTLNHLKGTIRDSHMGYRYNGTSNNYHQSEPRQQTYGRSSQNYDNEFPPMQNNHYKSSQPTPDSGISPDFLEMKNSIMLMQQQISGLASYIMPVRPQHPQMQVPARPQYPQMQANLAGHPQAQAHSM